MPSPLHAVAELPQFIRDAEISGLTEDERGRIIETIAAQSPGIGEGEANEEGR